MKHLKLFEGFLRENSLEAAKKEARDISKAEGVAQHVNQVSDMEYEVSDWYDAETTVASYENGRPINEADFTPGEPGEDNNPYDMIGNTWLEKILTEEVKSEIVEPKDGDFDPDYNFSDESGSLKDQEINWEFKGNEGEEYLIVVKYDIGWDVERSKFRGTHHQPADPNKIVLDYLNIHDGAFFYEIEEGNENDFILNDGNKELIKNMLEREIPADEVKI